jgi:small subunit ribosomal protein S8
MAFSDPIADLLTRIRNGLMAKHRFVDIDWSKMKESLVGILKEEGYVENFLVKKEETIGTIRVFLKYSKSRQPVIQGIKRASTPGCRKYVGSDDIRLVFGGMGISILSTSKGLMTGKKARQGNVGGELLCTVW